MIASENATDIIIPACNHYPYTRGLIEAIYRRTDVPIHMYIIDNASTDETAGLDKVFTRDLTLIHNRRDRGWCAAINQGIEAGNNPNVVFLDHKTEVAEGWLGNMLSFLNTHPRIGAVGPLGSNSRSRQHVDRVRSKFAHQIPIFRTEDFQERNRILKFHFHRAGILIEGMLDFFCVVLKRRTVEAVGLLEKNFGISGGEEDYCLRLRKTGYVLGLALDTYVIHHIDSQNSIIPFPDRSQGTYI